MMDISNRCFIVVSSCRVCATASLRADEVCPPLRRRRVRCFCNPGIAHAISPISLPTTEALAPPSGRRRKVRDVPHTTTVVTRSLRTQVSHFRVSGETELSVVGLTEFEEPRSWTQWFIFSIWIWPYLQPQRLEILPCPTVAEI